MFEDLNTGLNIMAGLAVVGVIFGIWKLIDIIIWAVNHISIIIK